MLSSATVALVNLEPTAARQLNAVLTRLGHRVVAPLRECRSVDLVFCGADSDVLRDTLERVHQENPKVPVVAVDPDGNEARWIEILEQGADDYLPYPCEPIQLAWLLQNNLHSSRTQ